MSKKNNEEMGIAEKMLLKAIDNNEMENTTLLYQIRLTSLCGSWLEQTCCKLDP